MRFLISLSLTLSILLLSFSAHAERRFKCPRFIADLSTGEFKKRKNNYTCLRSVRQAKKRGFVESTNTKYTNTFSGATDQSTASFYVPKPAIVSFRYIGDQNFSIVLRNSADGDYEGLIANEIGDISGSKGITQGNYYFDVTGVGSWTITVSLR